MPDTETPVAGQARRAEDEPDTVSGRTNDASAQATLLAALAAFRMATAQVEAVRRYLAGETAGIVTAGWTPVRDPETGQRLYDWHPSGKMRFVTKWHGERREAILPLPEVA